MIGTNIDHYPHTFNIVTDKLPQEKKSAKKALELIRLKWEKTGSIRLYQLLNWNEAHILPVLWNLRPTILN